MVATRSSNAPARPCVDAVESFSHPSEEELLGRHLRHRISDNANKQQLRASFIHDADVYTLGPAELTEYFAPAVSSNGDRAWYFFSPVRAKTRESQRKLRTVDSGEGSWHAEAGSKPVVDVDQPCWRIGHRRSFSFVTKVDGKRVRSGWLMVELELDGTDEVVLCKIYFSPRAHLHTSRAARATPAAAAASRKRKATAIEDNDKNPVRQRRHTYLPAEAASPPRANDDDDTAGAGPQRDEDTQGGGIGNVGSWSWPDFHGFHAGSLVSMILNTGEEFDALGYDRTDQMLLAELRLEEVDEHLDGAGTERREEPPQFPSYNYGKTDRNSGYPACLTWEDLYSTEPLWFENFRRGYSGLRHNRRRRR